MRALFALALLPGLALAQASVRPGEADARDGTSGAIEFQEAPFTTPRYGDDRPEPLPMPDTEARPGVRLRQLDKMTGQTETVGVATGETRRLGRLEVRVGACRAPEDGATKGTMAWLEIRDTGDRDAGRFSGWMFADSPALSALDHRRYDVWVISCTTVPGSTDSGSE